ncbi:hypothetical protein ENSA5_58360 [Enhygromyxa salina]|uniref:Uncharacterized protein n=1 Tax=Enhygromyxa salina TaxID=215803 RepID=A0A2S9XE12_9BACT|nr:hypothetical protein [Enhygromyxa salina]PRP91099.1 hypothetical protein ENSA5_58360 [Enhygromyxa salina]
MSDLLLGEINAALNIVPVLGGVLSSIVGASADVIEATLSSNSDGSTAINSISCVDSMQDYSNELRELIVGLINDMANGAEDAWCEPYTNPLTGTEVTLGQLAAEWATQADFDWIVWSEQLRDSWVGAYLQYMAESGYCRVFRSYEESVVDEQKWHATTVASFLADKGGADQYITSTAENYSVWFTNTQQDGRNVTTDEWWLTPVPDNAFDYANAYPAGDAMTTLFSSSGYGTTWASENGVEKSTVFQSWFMVDQSVHGEDVIGLWKYPAATGAYLVCFYLVQQTGPVNGKYVWTGVLQASTDTTGFALFEDGATISALQVPARWPA